MKILSFFNFLSFSLIISSFFSLSSCQYGIPTFQLAAPITTNLCTFVTAPNSISFSDGLEINMWVLPKFTLLVPQSQIFLTIASDIKFLLTYNPTPPQALSFSVFSVALGLSSTAQVPTISTSIWINLNIRMIGNNTNQYVLVNGWQGNTWNLIEPSFKLFLNQCNNYTDITIKISPTTVNFGLSIGEIRVYKFNENQAWGYYLQHFQQEIPSGFGNLLQFIKSDQVHIYDLNGITYLIYGVTQTPVLIGPEIIRCPSGYGMASTGDCPNICMQNGCLICQTINSNFDNSCRYCDPTTQQFTSCNPNFNCPSSDYKEHGICYLCPIGCNTCSNATYCLTCKTSLYMTKTPGVAYSQLCLCSTGFYESVVLAANTYSCLQCDDSCKTCTGNSITCTSCKATGVTPRYLNKILKSCVVDCTIGQPNYYNNVTLQTCEQCIQNCSTCTSYYGCTYCQSIVPAEILYNFNGECMTTCPTYSISSTSMGLITPDYYICYECGPHCATCITLPTTCLSCYKGYSLYDNAGTLPGVCMSPCPASWYSTGTACQKCYFACTTCIGIAQCLTCIGGYYYYNYICYLACPVKTYPDTTGSFWFCRDCPSNCATCTSLYTCQTCANKYYLMTYSYGTICVAKYECTTGQYYDAGLTQCNYCVANCKTCINSVACQDCNQNYILNTLTWLCSMSCPLQMYIAPSNKCTWCIANCQVCTDSKSCQTCMATYLLLSDLKTCVFLSCPSNYYLSGSSCFRCPSICSTCTSSLICTACISGYTLSTNVCYGQCGDGKRQSNEECDDGNVVSGDGCSQLCKLEDGYICDPIYPNVVPAGQDNCYCDAQFEEAKWTNYWGRIQVTFNTQIYFQTIYGGQSDDPTTFCSQILDPTSLSGLGTSYYCYLWNSNSASNIFIDVSSDSTIGNQPQNFATTIQFNPGVLHVKGCSTYLGIPTQYVIMNEPVHTPQIYFFPETGSSIVSKCQSSFVLSIYLSKGFTMRNIKTSWLITSFLPTNFPLQSGIQNIITIFNNYRSFTLSNIDINSLQGSTVTFTVAVTNFLNQVNSNSTTITFLNTKKLEIHGVTDVLALMIAQNYTITPKIRIPYCNSDSKDNQVNDTSSITYTCKINPISSPTSVKILDNCTIPANYMSINKQYSLLLQAYYPSNPSMNTNKVIIVNPGYPPIKIGQIIGCNRMFSVNNSFFLTVTFNTNINFAQINWYCNDVLTGSTCFSQSYEYIAVGTTQTVIISKDQLFEQTYYQFSVQITDTLTMTSDFDSCIMQSAPLQQQVIDLQMVSEQNSNGFIDYSYFQNSVKAQILNYNNTNVTNLTYSWSIADTSQFTYNQSLISINNNSVAINTTLLKRNNEYTFSVNVTDGMAIGNISVSFLTDPDISYQFFVEPLIGKMFDTQFLFSISSQQPFDDFSVYSFGYLDPLDSSNLVPLSPSSKIPFLYSALPLPSLVSTSLQCFCKVILPNQASKIYFQTVQITQTSYQYTQFQTYLTTAIVDDLSLSVNVLNQLLFYGSKMDSGNITLAVNKIIKGLQKIMTPLSDQDIQQTVSRVINQMSFYLNVTAPVDINTVTSAMDLFKQMTIRENSKASDGYYIKFTKYTSQNLLGFSNNIQSYDFSSYLGTLTLIDIMNSLQTGLKNILKGSLSNYLLGASFGFTYQGDHIFAQAMKFDNLEQNFIINVGIPTSLSNLLSQSFVNITLPNTTFSSNPCTQVTIIIQDNPTGVFLSNEKDAKLKSLIVDISIQKSELASLTPTIKISDIDVKNLIIPINITIPLSYSLNGSNSQTVLGCSYLDVMDNQFKMDGIKIDIINQKLVTCQCSHLTAITVQQYTSQVDFNALSDQTAIKAIDPYVAIYSVTLQSSWAVWVCSSLLVIMVLGIVWGYKRDKKDYLNYDKLQDFRNRLYVNVFIDNSRQHFEKTKQMKKPILTQVQQFQNEEKIPEEKKEESPVVVEQVDKKEIIKHHKKSVKKKKGLQKQNLIDEKMYDVNKKYKKKQEQFTVISEYQPQIQQHQSEQLYLDQIMDEIKAKSAIFQIEEESAFQLDTKRTTKKMVKKKKKKKTKKKNGLFDETMSEFRENIRDKDIKQGVQQINNNIFFEGGEEDTIKKKRRSSKSKSRSRRRSMDEENKNETFKLTGRSGNSRKSSRSSKSRTKSKKKEKKKDQESSSGINLRMNANFSGFKPAAKKDKNIDQKQTTSRSTSRQKFSKKEKKLSKRSSKTPEKLDQNLNNNSNQKPQIQQINFNEDNQDNQSDFQHFPNLNNQLFNQLNEEAQEQDEELLFLHKQWQNRRKKEIAAGCCVLCCWSVKEGHRCPAIYRHHSQYLSRPARVLLMTMSLMAFICLTGETISLDEFVDKKDSAIEQLVCGSIAAFLTRIVLIFLSNLMRTKKPHLQELKDGEYIYASSFIIIINRIRFWTGVFIVCGIISNRFTIQCFDIVVSYLDVFSLSYRYMSDKQQNWQFAFLFSILVDFVGLEGIQIFVSNFIILLFGVYPDTCLCCRGCILYMITQAIKDKVR